MSKESRLGAQRPTTERETLPSSLNDCGCTPKVSALREALYRKAKKEPKFRFYALYDRIYRRDVLEVAWRRVARNGGAPGVDNVRISDVKGQEGGAEQLVDELHEELRAKTFQPRAVRRTMIPKANGGTRPLGIPTVRDRVAQMAAVLVLEAIFEADFMDTSYGFRPGRSAHDALRAAKGPSAGTLKAASCGHLKTGQLRKGHLESGRREVLDADLKGYFDTIPHDKLMKALEMRISDRSVLRLIRLWLRAPTEERDEQGDRRVRKRPEGTPQGGVISPLLANAYLHWLDKLFMAQDGPGYWAGVPVLPHQEMLPNASLEIAPGLLLLILGGSRAKPAPSRLRRSAAVRRGKALAHISQGSAEENGSGPIGGRAQRSCG